MDQRASRSIPRPIGSAGSVLGSNGRFPVWYEDSPVSALASGAAFDGVTDDTVILQAFIDEVADAGGGVIRWPNNLQARASIELREGVYIEGPGRGYPPSSINMGSIKAAAAGAAVRAQDIRNCGISGVNVVGLGAGTAVVGVHFENVVKGIVSYLAVDQTSDQGILIDAASGGCVVEVIQVTNALLNRTRSARSGAVEILGTDHWVRDVEATASVTGAVTSADLRCAAILIGMTNGECDGLMGEISDVGIYLTGDQNRIVNARADLNRGHGFVVSGTRNQIANALALNNGKAATDTYDGFLFEATGTANQTANLKAESQSTSTEKHKYGLRDLAATATQKNRHLNPFSTGATTRQYLGSSSNGSAFHFPMGAPVNLAANSTTPDVTGLAYVATLNGVATTITDFLGGVPGQEITVYCSDANTTVQHNGATISLAALANKALSIRQHYKFVYTGAVWRDVTG